MVEDNTNDIINNEKLKLHIMVKKEVAFTLCGYFNLDYTLLHSIITSITSMLFILIQFGEPISIIDT
ncbi:unnamed protein product [Nezara viridula]|uniref:Uncharacterized protein n=1 Tax=Nezara viridula TaxID=85310 RepID=A0A9P0H2C4_NEZVI|nr:unnamed protein product [Nezara viridula]